MAIITRVMSRKKVVDAAGNVTEAGSAVAEVIDEDDGDRPLRCD
jgi:hypothetical protein